MDILYAALIFAGLSLDSFVMMMNQASRLADLHKKDILLYCTVFSLAASAAMLMGYGAAIPLKTVVADKNEQALACLIILVTGLYILMKSLKNKAPEEKADREFNAGRCARIAAFSRIHTFLMGICFSFLGFGVFNALGLLFAMTMIDAAAAIWIGYTQGSRYYRAVGMFGGTLIIVFGFLLLAKYVVR